MIRKHAIHLLTAMTGVTLAICATGPAVAASLDSYLNGTYLLLDGFQNELVLTFDGAGNYTGSDRVYDNVNTPPSCTVSESGTYTVGADATVSITYNAYQNNCTTAYAETITGYLSGDGNMLVLNGGSSSTPATLTGIKLSQAPTNYAAGLLALAADTTSGTENLATGYGALSANTTGVGNTAAGYMALNSNTTAWYNVAFGALALSANTTGSPNDAFGAGALGHNTTGHNNGAFGDAALLSNTTGSRNNAAGSQALYANTTANDNNAMGVNALYSNTTGSLNNAMGNYALEFNTSGYNNNAMGYGSLLDNTTGADNSAQGYFALAGNTSGNLNIGVGYKAGSNLTTGSNNIDIGNPGVATEAGTIRIGMQGTQTATYLAGVSGANVTGGSGVVVDTSGHLGIVSSSRRYKEDIRPLGEASERVYELRPVAFRYRQADERGEKPIQYGLVAEDVAETLPELVVYDAEGRPATVAYQVLPTLLLNELQKEHQELQNERQRGQAQSDEIADLKAQVAELRQVTTRLLATQR